MFPASVVVQNENTLKTICKAYGIEVTGTRVYLERTFADLEIPNTFYRESPRIPCFALLRQLVDLGAVNPSQPEMYFENASIDLRDPASLFLCVFESPPFNPEATFDEIVNSYRELPSSQKEHNPQCTICGIEYRPRFGADIATCYACARIAWRSFSIPKWKYLLALWLHKLASRLIAVTPQERTSSH